MTADKPSSLVPKLRFPEFRNVGVWESTKCGDIADFHKGKGLPKSMLSTDGTNQCIHYGELFTAYPEVIRTVNSRTDFHKKPFLSAEDDVLMPTSDVTPNGLAKACCVKLRDVIIGGDILVIRADKQKVVGEFLSRYIRRLEHRVLQLVTGSTVYHLYATELRKLDLYVPNKSEQQKIADCLGALDDLIAAESRKLDSLQQHKQGLIQQFFPKPGETIPRLRFPEFKSRRDWQYTMLSDVLKEHGLKSDGTSEVHSVSLAKGIVPQIAHLGRSYAANNTTHYNLVESSDVVYTRSPLGDFKLGIVKQHKGEHNAIISPLYGVFRPRNRHLGLMIEAYFHSPSRSIQFLDPLAQKGAKNTIQLSNNRFLSGALYLPKDADEQQKIAECLGFLDDLIAAESRKLDALQQHKQGLIQQLFPSL